MKTSWPPAWLAWTMLAWLPLPGPALAAAPRSLLIETIRGVVPDGRTNAEAARAWRQLAQADARQLPRILAAMDGATPVAANWLRCAVDAIAERTLARGGRLPAGPIEQFVRDRQHQPRARHLAFQWLARVDPTAPDRLIPGMLQDPSVDLRREAVARRIDRANRQRESGQRAAAVASLREALDGARDGDQIRDVAQQLRDLGHPVNLPRQFGFLMDWKVIGPFDNTLRKGFDTVYPPEQQIDLQAEYQGKTGPVRWLDLTCEDPYGMVDLNQPFGRLKQTVAYAYTVFTSDHQRHAELRLGCKNAWKLWLNGQLVFGREEYHRRTELDQYRFPVTLKPGRNEILLKVCQNEEVESWTVEWEFQIRVCDAVGTAILSTTRPPGR